MKTKMKKLTIELAMICYHEYIIFIRVLSFYSPNLLSVKSPLTSIGTDEHHRLYYQKHV